MSQAGYDIVTVGGGLGGAALAKSMAENGFRVIVLEREKEFRDRVRGEQMACWGVAEARELGIYELLVNGACGQEVRWWETCVGRATMGRRDFLKSTPQQVPQFMFYHPRMQEILASAAQETGAEYRRGETVTGVEAGEPATVLFDNGGATERLSARLVVGADGRGSLMRKWGGFVVRHDPPRRLIAGVLFDRMLGAPSDSAYFHIAPSLGRAVLLVPQGNGRVRAYLVYPHDAPIVCREQLTFPDSLMNPSRSVFRQSSTLGRALPALSRRLTVQITGSSIPTAVESRSLETRPRLMTHASAKDYHSPFVMRGYFETN